MIREASVKVEKMKAMHDEMEKALFDRYGEWPSSTTKRRQQEQWDKMGFNGNNRDGK